MRIGIDVVQPHPDAELAELAREIEELRADLAAAPLAGGVFDIDAVGRGVLRDHQQFLDAGGDQPLGLAQHVGGRPRHQIAAQLRDDAEGAAVVAALGNLQIRVVPRRQLDAFRRHQIEERIVLRRRRAMHGVEHALVLLRAGDRRARWGMCGGDLLRLGAHAAGDDDLAVFRQRLADGGERFRLGAVEKAAGVDDDEVGAGVLARQLIALGAQARDDALAIDQRLRAAERDEAHFRRAFYRRISSLEPAYAQELTAIRRRSRQAPSIQLMVPQRLGFRVEASFPSLYGFPCLRG